MTQISVIIVCYNEENNIADCLNSLALQTYPVSKFTIEVVDGNSSDNSQAIINDFIKSKSRHLNVNLHIEYRRGTAVARNRGVREATNSLVAFIDADCIAPREWLETLATAYLSSKKTDRNIIAVGGRNLAPINADRFIKAIEISLDSYIGSFGSIQGRQFDSARYVDSLATLNVLYEKSPLESVGLFDESLLSEAEDAELNYRLILNGHCLYFVPESFVWHKMRNSPTTWFKNMFRYGKARARLLKRYPRMWHPKYWLPLVFLMSLVFIVLFPVSKLFLAPIFYFPLILAISITVSYKARLPLLFGYVACVYVIEHFGYSMGLLYGLCNRKVT